MPCKMLPSQSDPTRINFLETDESRRFGIRDACQTASGDGVLDRLELPPQRCSR